MLPLIDVVLPVFLVLGAGYAATRLRLFSDSAVDGLVAFTQHFAIPCLLFRATWQLDFSRDVSAGLLTSFYAGAILSFFVGIAGARWVFRRKRGEAVSIGFLALYSNSLMLGLPITERAYGAAALAGNYAIVAFHVPICFLLGITVMEIARSDGRGFTATVRLVLRAMFRNALTLAIILGFAVNWSGVSPPAAVGESIDMMIRAALPAAIFAIGGVLTRYTLRSHLAPVAMVAVLSLVLHPGITWVLSTHVFDLSPAMIRSAVLTAAMAPGISAYIFASMYNRATDVASSAVLLCTMISIATITAWLSILP